MTTPGNSTEATDATDATESIDAILTLAPVIPVLVIDDLDVAVPLARALVRGGLSVLEITLRTGAALHAVRAIVDAVPDAVTGVGTVTTPAQLADSVAAGARFAVSPGLTPALADAARGSAIPLLPGVMTPSEVMFAQEQGYRRLKLFPASIAGGAGMLKALGGPFPEVRFCPTGGVTLESMPGLLALPNVICVGGSWVAPADAVQKGDWDRIAALAAEAVSAAGRS